MDKRKQAEEKRLYNALKAYNQARPDLRMIKINQLRPGRFKPIWVQKSLYTPPFEQAEETLYTIGIDKAFSHPIDKAGIEEIIVGLQAMIAPEQAQEPEE